MLGQFVKRMVFDSPAVVANLPDRFGRVTVQRRIDHPAPVSFFRDGGFMTANVTLLLPGFIGDDHADGTGFPKGKVLDVPGFDRSLLPVPALGRLTGAQSARFL